MPLPFHSLENPFETPRKRNPDDAELVGKILGPEEERAMREALGEVGAPKKEPEEDWGDLRMSEEEKKKVKEAQERAKPETPEQVRQRFIEWAAEFDLGINPRNGVWIDKTFAFHPDGSVTVEENLAAGEHDVTYLPKGLREVGGNLYLYRNKLISLEGLEGVSVGGDLSLDNNQLTSLEGLPREIGGDLSLTYIPATEIPKGLNIGGVIQVHRDQTTLAEDIKKKYPGKLEYSI